MRQGEIWLASLNPAKGSEQAGKRPVVIISGDTLNDALPIVIVIPITARMKSYPACVPLKAQSVNGLKHNSEAITFQVRAITKQRLTKCLGRVSASELKAMIRGLFIVLTH
jgi:mRNA interferase MazF